MSILAGVHAHVAMAHELATLGLRAAEPEPVDHVREAALELLQQELAETPFSWLARWKVRANCPSSMP